MIERFSLLDGHQIPSVGFGTWQMSDEQAVAAVRTAIEVGYRHIDTAAVYKCERGVGQGIKESGVQREQLFVTSKVWNTCRGYDPTMLAFEQTMARLQLDYLDLYLIHWPAAPHQFSNWRELNAESFRAMAELQKQGRITSIGVSNFKPHHLEALIEDTGITPVVDQIEYHPGFNQQPTVDYCREHGIVVEAWSPLGRGRVLQDATLTEIASHYGASVAQVCLRWALQNGVVPLPKSVTPKRIAANLQLDFEISEADMQRITGLEPFGGSGLDPDTVDF